MTIAELMTKLDGDLRVERERVRELQQALDVARINVQRLTGGLAALRMVEEPGEAAQPQGDS